MQICAPRGAGFPSPPDPPTVMASGLGLPSFVLSEPHTLALLPALASGEQSMTGAGEAWHRQDLRKWDPEGHAGTCSRDSRVTASNQRRRRNREKCWGWERPPPAILSSRHCPPALPPHRRPGVSASLRCTLFLLVWVYSLVGVLSYLMLEAGAWVGSGCFCTPFCDWRQWD